MKRDRLTLTLIIVAALTALFDLAYITVVAVEYAQALSGARFISAAFAALSLSAVIINAVALLFAAAYLFLRRRGTVIK